MYYIFYNHSIKKQSRILTLYRIKALKRKLFKFFVDLRIEWAYIEDASNMRQSKKKVEEKTMTNKTNNSNLISMMVLNKYHENAVSSVLKPHVSSDSLHQSLSDLWDFCMLRREAYRAQGKFYLKHNNCKKYLETDKAWLRYVYITEAFQYYYFMTSAIGTDETYSLSYKIITNKLTY